MFDSNCDSVHPAIRQAPATGSVTVQWNAPTAGTYFSRIDKYDFDKVLWYEPDRAAKETAPQLKDRGVQVIGVSDRWFPSIRCRYEVQRESAIMSILRDWRANDAITSVVVVRGLETSAAREELLKTFLEEEGIRLRI